MDRRDKKRLMIAECLNELLKDKPIDDITVVELCKKAEMARSTFYIYFDDIYAVGEWLWNHEYRAIFAGLGKEYGLYECNVRLHRSLKSNAQRYGLVTPMRNLEGSHTFAELNTLQIYIERIEAMRGYPLDPDELEHLAYISQANEAMTLKWFKDGMTVSPERLAEFIVGIAPQFMVDALGA